MQQYAKFCYTLDLEENEGRIRWVAAPIQDATGAITVAITVSSAAECNADKSCPYGGITNWPGSRLGPVKLEERHKKMGTPQ